MPRPLLQHALTWLTGLIVLAQLALLVTLPAASQSPPAGPFATLEAPGRAALAITLGLAIPYAVGRLASRSASPPRIILITVPLSILAALLALVLADYLDPFINGALPLVFVGLPVLIAASLELHGLEFLTRPDEIPPRFRITLGAYDKYESTYRPNVLTLAVVLPFLTAAALWASEHGVLHWNRTPHHP